MDQGQLTQHRNTLLPTAPQVIERGLVPLLDAHRVADLARLHGLCGRVAALDALRAAYKAWVTKTGTVIVRDEEKVGQVLHAACTLGWGAARLAG
jgi:hypothetical protein